MRNEVKCESNEPNVREFFCSVHSDEQSEKKKRGGGQRTEDRGEERRFDLFSHAWFKGYHIFDRHGSQCKIQLT